MKQIKDTILEGNEIALWGVGNNFEKNIEKLKKYIPIKFVCDNNSEKYGKFFHGLECVSKDKLNSNSFVIITVTNKDAIKDIINTLAGKCDFCRLEEALEFCNLPEEEKIVEENKHMLSKDDSTWNNIMKKYVGLHVPANICNLKCPYCYIRQNDGFLNKVIFPHLPEYVRLCLSQKKLGGQVLIGICGTGETLLCDKIIDIAVELLKEGHFLHIVTNGTLTEKIKELIEKSGKYANHIFFKFSFHYGEFLRKNLLDTFAQSVKYVLESEASFTVELTTDDNLIEQIEDIKKYSLDNFGALPHITIARDDTKPDIPIFTKLDLEEYYRIWSSFDSKLFDVKWKYFGKYIKNCYAGQRSLYIDLMSGNIMKCLKQPSIDNIYATKNSLLEYEYVDNNCNLPYCYNNHAYLTLGISPDIETCSFAEVRDRVTINGKHWVKSEVYKFMDQKLYDNN